MQPYFFPYLGYFELIHRTDRWVVFDVVQYKPKSWMNRNRILHPTDGWQYIGVPVEKFTRGDLIQDIKIKDKDAALSRILGQLNHYKKFAPYFSQVVNLVKESFNSVTSNRLVDLNVSTLIQACIYIGIDFKWSLCSELSLNFDDVTHPGQWALEISKQLGAKQYINLPGGKDIFNPQEWEDAEIDLQFTEIANIKYACAPYCFVDNLSILDVLMWNSPEKVITYLHA